MQSQGTVIALKCMPRIMIHKFTNCSFFPTLLQLPAAPVHNGLMSISNARFAADLVHLGLARTKLRKHLSVKLNANATG